MSAMTTRMADLLRLAANEFARYANPFDENWLVQNAVTLDECGSLSEKIADAIRFYLGSDIADKMGFVLREAGVDEDIVKGAIEHFRFAKFTKEAAKR